MKREKNKNAKDIGKHKNTIKEPLHNKIPTENLVINLSYPIKININNYPKKINIIKSAFERNKTSMSQKQAIISKTKLFNNWS